MFKMIIGSDIVPTETNFDLFEKADVETLAGKELLDILNDKKPLVRGITVMIVKAIPSVIKGIPNLMKI